MPLSAGARLGPYEVTAAIGAGGMGEVYRARDPRLERDVAIKLLPSAISSNPERLHRFEQEARATAALNHPNILAVHDIGTDGSATFVVSELLEGESLRSALAEVGALPLRKAIDYGIQIAKGLAAAHDKGIVHRDLKPENLFIMTDGRAKILDFGLAKLVTPTEAGSMMPTSPATEPGVVLGTVGYMSPEQVRGRAVDHRSDIFSFGAVMYETLSGRRAFAEESAAETMSAIVKNEPADLSTVAHSVPPAIERIIARCLEKAPDSRFQSARDLAFALETVSTSSQATPAVETKPRAPARERLAWSLVAFLGIAAATSWLLPRTRPTPVDERVLRYTLPWPESVNQVPFANNVETVALSPDGRRLAFIGRSGSGTAIWIRELDSGEARAVPGARGGSSMFWSPDSRNLAWIVGRTLWKIDVSLGPSVQIAELPAQNGSGGSWNQFGDILVGTVGDGVLRVSDQGGPMTSVTTVDRAKGEIGHRWPHFLPDGKRFLMFASGATDEVNVAQLDGGERSVLLRTDGKAVFAAPGTLFFPLQGTVFGQPFDPDSGVLSGEPKPIAERVLNASESGSTAFTASQTGVIAYLNSGGAPPGQLAWFSRDGKAVGTIGEVGTYANARLSPDGTRVAVQKTVNGSRDVWVMDLTRGSSAPSTRLDPDNGQQPVWSPDGMRIVYSIGTPGPSTFLQRPASGAGAAESILKFQGPAAPNDWGADGVLYHKGNGLPPTHLVLLDKNGQSRTIVDTPRVAIDGRFSPDGKWLAYVSTESDRPEVYLQNYPAMTTKTIVSTGGGIQPVWRRDGKELFYLDPDNRIMAVSITPGDKPIRSAPQPLFTARLTGGGSLIGGGVHHDYDVSLDGQKFLVLTGGPRNDGPFNVIVNWPAVLKK